MTLAVLGTGIMGAAMARNWLGAGETVRVWNRTRSHAEPLAHDGATVADSAAAAVDGADVIVTMLYDADSVARTMEAAAPGLREGQLWLQMTTVGVPGVDQLGEVAAQHGLRYVDAPVLGTRQPAEQGKLIVLGSGAAELREPVTAIAQPVAARVEWLGEAGVGSRAKLVVNSWVVSVMAGLGQAYALAEGLGVDQKLFLDLIGGGALDLPYAKMKGPAMMSREYPTSFPLNGAAKDARLIGEAARAAGVDSSIVDSARALLDKAVERGHADADVAAVYEAFRP
jgi:3-hydroxyisobutyrate dehydrogenase